MMSWITQPEAWIALATLTALEIVLGIDNIIFISILVGRLPEHQRQRARVLGLGLAMLMRIALLLTLAWMMRLTSPLFSVFGQEISGRDVILIGGGLFLLAKATYEIHGQIEEEEDGNGKVKHAGFVSILVQIGLLDIVFSLDSVITAVGMARHVPVMVLAIMIAIVVMMISAKAVGGFIDRHLTVRMLALSFLVLIGVALIGEGLDLHIPKGYIYFAMAFSVLVELLNMKLRSRRKQATATSH
jgi:predicted tellurium resistance membrane protein TerC